MSRPVKAVGAALLGLLLLLAFTLPFRGTPPAVSSHVSKTVVVSGTHGTQLIHHNGSQTNIQNYGNDGSVSSVDNRVITDAGHSASPTTYPNSEPVYGEVEYVAHIFARSKLASSAGSALKSSGNQQVQSWKTIQTGPTTPTLHPSGLDINGPQACTVILRLPLIKKLGCGCVSCAYLSSYKNTTVVVKRMSDINCKMGDLRKVFFNQIQFAKLGIQHPNLEHIYGTCDHHNHPALVLEYMPSGRLSLRWLHSLALHEKLQLVYGVAQLMTFLGTKSSLFPGSPYTLCDYAARQFGYVNGTLKLMDFDMVIPMRRSFRYRVIPGIEKSMKSWVGGRIYAASACKLNHPCYTNCLFGWKQKLHELICQKVNISGIEVKLCPGLGMKASVFMFGSQFLRHVVADKHAPVKLLRLTASATSYYEEQRPTLLQMVRTMESIYEALLHNQTYCQAIGVRDLPPLGNPNFTLPPTALISPLDVKYV